MSGFLVFDIGCLECGESSGVVGIYADEATALAARTVAAERQAEAWRGEHRFMVIDLANPTVSDYAPQAIQ